MWSLLDVLISGTFFSRKILTMPAGNRMMSVANNTSVCRGLEDIIVQRLETQFASVKRPCLRVLKTAGRVLRSRLSISCTGIVLWVCTVS